LGRTGYHSTARHATTISTLQKATWYETIALATVFTDFRYIG